LYPAGNGNATVMGRSHARADATIGPAVVTFRCIAAMDIASSGD